jgi:Flp pilus assembly protein TadG
MKRLRGENGVEMLEFALVIPIFVFVLYGLIAFGIMLSAKQTITHSAAEGARGAIGAVPNQGESQDDADKRVAKDRVRQSMGSLSQYNVDDPTQFDATVNWCSGNSGPRCITVKITYPYSDKPLVPPAPGLGLMMPSTLGSTAIVQVS